MSTFKLFFPFSHELCLMLEVTFMQPTFAFSHFYEPVFGLLEKQGSKIKTKVRKPSLFSI